jgi:hypothetical protein
MLRYLLVSTVDEGYTRKKVSSLIISFDYISILRTTSTGAVGLLTVASKSMSNDALPAIPCPRTDWCHIPVPVGLLVPYE